MTSLHGKIAVVTGASTGIGFAIAQALAAQGAKVVAVARNIEPLQALKNGSITPIKTDMTKESEVLALFKNVAQTFGRLDILINNAGMSSARAGLVDGDYQAYTDVVTLNVLGLTLATREGVQLMESGGTQGHVINISSILGHGAAPNAENLQFYSGTKHMVTALTEGLRKSVQKKNIRVTSISPGIVETEIVTRSSGAEAAKAFFGRYKVLEPRDIADAVIYALTAPAHVNIDELTITPLMQDQL